MNVPAGIPLSPAAVAACVESLDAVGFAVVDAAGVVRTWNRGAATLLGVPASAATGRPLSDVCGSADERLRNLAVLHAAAAGVRLDLSRAGGPPAPFLVQAFPLGPDWMVRLEPVADEGHRPSDLFALALAHTRDAVFLAQPDGLVTYWNEAATRLLGWTAEEVVGRPLVERFPDAVKAEFAEKLREVLAGQDWSGEYEDWRKDGSRVWIDAYVRALRDARGHVVGVVGAAHDVSARRAAEAALLERDRAYRAAIETTHDGFWIVDREGRLLDVNEAYVRKSGYTRDELLSMRIADLEVIETPEAVRAHADRIRQVGHTRFETVHRAKDGTTWPMEITTSYSADQDRFFVFVRDITERRQAEQAMREAEERFRFALGAVGAGAWEWNILTDHVIWSPETYDLHGIERGAPSSYALWASAIHPDDHDRCTQLFASVLESDQEAFRMEYRVIHRNGEVRWLLDTGRVHRDAAGRPVQVLGIDIDITERQEALLALRASESRLAEAQAAARLGSWSWTPDTGDVWWSDTVYDLFGLPHDTRPSFEAFLDILHPEDRGIALGRVQRVLDGAEGFADDLRVILRTGTVRWLDSRARVVRDAQGRVLRVDGTDQDITERKRAEEALRATEERLSMAQSAARMGSWSWDPREDRAWWSDATYELYGVDRTFSRRFDDYLGLLHPEDRALVLQRMEDNQHTNDEYSTDLRIVRPDGRLVWVANRVFAIRDQDGTVLRIEGVDVDITARKLAEETLLRQQRVLERIAESAPLETTLAELVLMVEAQLPGSVCSILLVDASQRLRVGAAPSLPPQFTALCDGVPVGPASGSCGAAAYLGETIVVEDIETHPNWRQYREAALAHGLRSCLSIPILATGRVEGVKHGSVLATFAIYRRETGPPDPVAFAIAAGQDGLGATAASSGSLAGVTHLARVAIERHRAEEALRASEARFRDVLDASPASISLKDLDGRLLFVNRRVVERTGRPLETWIGHTMDEVVPPVVAETLTRHDRQVVASMQPVQIEHTLPEPGGGYAAYLSLIFPLFRPGGEPYAICSISTDITSQKEAQEQRNLLWNLSPDPMCVAGNDGYFKQLNPAWTQRFGWSADQLLASPVLTFFHPDDVPRAREAFQRLMQGAAVTNVEGRFRVKDGSYHWLSWNAVPLPGGATVHGFVRDVTEQRRLAEQLQQAQKIEAVGQLAGGIAHDFNNLLTVINGFTALLLASPTLLDSQREPLKAVHDAGDRAAALTAQLLAFSRKAMVEPKVLDLSEVTETASRMLRRLIGEDIRIETRLNPDLPRVRIDPNQLEQVLMNLVLNARDAMPTGGLLRIETSVVERTASSSADVGEIAGGRYVQLSVADSGEGMTADVKARIFEPFFTTKGVGKGTGLGLATVYGIVRQAGGTIDVESESGRGSTFLVRLPALDQPRVAAVPTRTDASPAGHECVLLVEDEDGVRRLARVALEMRGYTVIEAASASEALRVAGRHDGRIDLLVTDVVMPGAGGRQLADELRRTLPDIRVLYMSGYTNDAVVRHGVEANIDAFLQKPFTPDVLARKVRDLLDARTGR